MGLILTFFLAGFMTHFAEAQTTTRVSVDSNGLQGNGTSGSTSRRATISADGNVVAFPSDSTNLVLGDTNSLRDVFVHNRQTGQTIRASIGPEGIESDEGNVNAGSSGPSLSGDGRFVAWESAATNLVAGDTNNVSDIFVHDTQTGETTRVSVDSTGVEGNSVSTDPVLSEDGRFVAFVSLSSNLIQGDTNSSRDIFVHDRQTSQTTRVSVITAGEETDVGAFSPGISADGRYIGFRSAFANLGPQTAECRNHVYVHDRNTGQTTLVDMNLAGDLADVCTTEDPPSLSDDGLVVAFISDATNLVPNDTNGVIDVFVHNRQTGGTSRVSVSSAGVPGNEDSGLGGNRFPGNHQLSANGQVVFFTSEATNLVADDTNGIRDIFQHDRQTGTTTRLELRLNGIGDDVEPLWMAINGTAQVVMFVSDSDNVVPDDTNNRNDVFVQDEQGPLASLKADIFPAGRAVQVGNLATAFYNIENTGTTDAIGCGIAPLAPVPGALFLYAPVDPVTSALTGPANTPVDIPAGTVQKFNITFVPNTQLLPTDVQLTITCANAALAASTSGINTLLLSASMTPVVDMVALTSAPGGMVVLPTPTATGAFLIASLNLGASDLVTMSADSGSSSLPLSLLVCEFDASIGNCLAVPSPTTSRTINTGEVTFYAVFVVGQGTAIPLNAATNRVFVRFRDSSDVVRGLTSVAVQVQ